MPSHTTFLCPSAERAFELSHRSHGLYWSSMVLIPTWVWLRQAKSHWLSLERDTNNALFLVFVYKFH